MHIHTQRQTREIGDAPSKDSLSARNTMYSLVTTHVDVMLHLDAHPLTKETHLHDRRGANTHALRRL